MTYHRESEANRQQNPERAAASVRSGSPIADPGLAIAARPDAQSADAFRRETPFFRDSGKSHESSCSVKFSVVAQIR
jgi:hypothetical protein